jgi:hypothetical protein
MTSQKKGYFDDVIKTGRGKLRDVDPYFGFTPFLHIYVGV